MHPEDVSFVSCACGVVSGLVLLWRRVARTSAKKRYLGRSLLHVLACTAATWLGSPHVSHADESVLLDVGNIPMASSLQPWFKGELEAFQALHSDITVQVHDFNTPDRKRVGIHELPKIARNVIGISSWAGYEVAYFASRDMLVPLDALEGSAEILERFDANLLEPVKFGGKTWAVPFMTQPLVLAYQPALLKAEGIESPPKTWEEFADVVARLTKDSNGDGRTDQYGLALLDMSVLKLIYTSMIFQNEFPLFSETGINAANSSVKNSIEFLHGMIYGGQALIAIHLEGLPGIASEKDARGYYPGKFENGPNFAMEIVDARRLETLSQSKDFALAQIPSSGIPVVANTGSVYLAIRKSTPKEMEASWELLKWICRQDAPLTNAICGYPCQKNTPSRADVQKFREGRLQNWKAFYECNARLIDPGPNDLVGRQLGFERFVYNVALALGSQMSLDKALQLTESEAQTFVHKLPQAQTRSFEIYR